jgi:hypothetical protein
MPERKRPVQILGREGTDQYPLWVPCCAIGHSAPKHDQEHAEKGENQPTEERSFPIGHISTKPLVLRNLVRQRRVDPQATDEEQKEQDEVDDLDSAGKASFMHETFECMWKSSIQSDAPDPSNF